MFSAKRLATDHATTGPRGWSQTGQGLDTRLADLVLGRVLSAVMISTVGNKLQVLHVLKLLDTCHLDEETTELKMLYILQLTLVHFQM